MKQSAENGNTRIGAVTVYCSSSSVLSPEFYEAGRALGRAIAARKWRLIYGGNCVGLMGELANAVRAQGGQVVGITPQLFIDKGIGDNNCEEFLVAKSMRHRKEMMEERGDAFITMPGGLGTFEEIFEIIVGKQLGYHNKPIVLLNVNEYFAPLLEMIEHGIEQKFIKTKARELYFVAPNVESTIDHIVNYQPKKHDGKWFLPSSVSQPKGD
ncbi:MAG TPA: TIGR00730 family Rossman fold protein [Tepidisphaeraceae bacterium]|jgi:uncharacterized protein (TIGR00730 family)|nr:TIGR00730 family Rossman fold protein [Tepidisphaeraceae bacterium]